MSDNIDIITNALEYYDSNNEKYQKIFKNAKYFKYVDSNSDIDHDKLILLDENKKEIFQSRIEIIGMYVANTNIWTWGWAITRFTKNLTFLVKKLINYGIELDPSAAMLKDELINSRFKISHPIQLDIHCAIASYLTKKPIVYKLFYEQNYIKEARDKNELYEIKVPKSNFFIYYFFFIDNPDD
uniref:Uncharacterized protein n=1 Tax=viral metagenome TaxID=1070528 RepID=A0A6C0E9W9_9ZZZZ